MTRYIWIDPGPVELDGPEPDGYLEWHEWAAMQVKAKRKQAKCPKCLRYWWPHTGLCITCEKEGRTRATFQPERN